MITLGERQTLVVSHQAPQGVYLMEEGYPDTKVLLPRKQVPEGTQKGDQLEVFLYKDSEDRLIATTKIPAVTLGEIALLPVAAAGKIGAFLSWGLDKDLLLPFKEQTRKVQQGDVCPVALYVDKTGRLCATMKLYSYLSSESPYKEGDHVTGTIYEVKKDMGAFVAVENRYHGMIPAREVLKSYRPGEVVECRVTKVRPDGKLDLSCKEKAYVQMDKDADLIMEYIEQNGGFLALCDESSPEAIKERLNMSKNAFKRAAGRLLKAGKIEFVEKGIQKK